MIMKNTFQFPNTSVNKIQNDIKLNEKVLKLNAF